jgi:hypothetical protein
LARLCSVSKNFYEIFIPRLYETIDIKARDEWHLGDLSLDPLLRTLSERPECLAYIRNVRIHAPIHCKLDYRCLHNEDIVDTEDSEDEDVDEGQDVGMEVIGGPSQRGSLNDLGSNLLTVLCQLRNNSLHSFK